MTPLTIIAVRQDAQAAVEEFALDPDFIRLERLFRDCGRDAPTSVCNQLCLLGGGEAGQIAVKGARPRALGERRIEANQRRDLIVEDHARVEGAEGLLLVEAAHRVDVVVDRIPLVAPFGACAVSAFEQQVG